jgi:hypothetical protein
MKHKLIFYLTHVNVLDHVVQSISNAYNIGFKSKLKNKQLVVQHILIIKNLNVKFVKHNFR